MSTKSPPPKSKRPSRIWNPEYYFVELLPNGKRKATCNFCAAKSYTENASKMKDHILQCPQADEDTKLQFQPTKRLRDKGGKAGVAVQSTSLSSAAASSGGKSFEDMLALGGLGLLQQHDEQNTAVNRAFARWIYSANLPLSATETPYFREFAKKVRPGWKYPTHLELGNALLDGEVADADAMNANAIEMAETIVVQSNGWGSVEQSPINFMAVCDRTPIYLGTIDGTSESPTSAYIAKVIKSKICAVGADKVFAVCTDDTANMCQAWHLLHEDSPSLTCFGCAAHSLSLYGKDVVRIPEIKAIVSNGDALLKWLKFERLPHTILNEKCVEKPLFVVPLANSRWDTVFYSLTRLQQLRTPIEQTVMDPRLQLDANKVPDHIVQLVLDDVFWKDTEAVTHILRPLAKALLFTESDTSQPGLISHVFQQMKSFTEESDDCQHFGRDVHQKLLNICQVHADFCLSDVHFAANILDPRFRGELLTEDQDVRGMQFISKVAQESNLAAKSPDFETQVFERIGEFKTMTGNFSHKFKWNAAKTMHPVSWWNSFHSSNLLSMPARKILNVMPTAGRVDHNWKRHTPVQTQLDEEQIKKLLHVSSSLTLRKNIQKKELSGLVADLCMHNFNVIHPEGAHMDDADSRMLMELMESGQLDVNELKTSGREESAD